MKPNQNGILTVNNFDAQNYSTLVVVATNLHNAVTEIVSLDNTPTNTRDLRHTSQMNDKLSYAISRTSESFLKSQSCKIEDITSTQFELVDSVTKVFGLFKELKNLKYGSKDLDIWEFLRNWTS